jgi:hypothetical protein
VKDGEFVCLARAFIKSRWWGDKVGNINRFPGSLPLGGISDLTIELDSRIPDPRKVDQGVWEKNEGGLTQLMSESPGT